MTVHKQRLDQVLIARGVFETRARAQAAIREGQVMVAGLTARKASQMITETDEITLADTLHDYVSRGALKLERGLTYFDFDPAGKTCLDVGASTGGFCDVLLRGGAKKIFAVDVGHGQLHHNITADPRVINLEKTNAKILSTALVPEPVHLLVCDVSFISLRKALPAALQLLAGQGEGIVLIKPQFELGPDFIGKGGLVTADGAQLNILLDEISQWFCDQAFTVLGVIDSPIKGGDGNREYLMGIRKK